VFGMKKPARNTNITAVASTLRTKHLCTVNLLLLQGFDVTFMVNYIISCDGHGFLQEVCFTILKVHVKKM
jgi:hypothetical protein